MNDEYTQLLDKAIAREVDARQLYLDGAGVAGDPTSADLMKELAEEELKHIEYLENIKEQGFKKSRRRDKEVADLKIIGYLEGGEKLESAGVQDTLIFAIRHEQESVEFYSRLMSAVTSPAARELCEKLVHQELKHKLKLETLYDDMVFLED